MSFLQKLNRNTIIIGIAVIGILITGVLIFVNTNHSFSLPSIFGISDNQVGKNAVDYINTNKLAQSTASLVSASEVSGMVKITIKIGENKFDSYVTKDGRYLFPAGNGVPFDMKPAKAAASTDKTPASTTTAKTPAEAAASVTKTDKPALEAFIVARCPFGLQMQRMIADAVKNIPSLAQYIKVRYFGSVSGDKLVSMHGDAEAAENLRQICIREEQPAKYWDYVSCQMKTGDTTGCEKSTAVDSAKLSACTTTASRGIAYAQKDFSLSDKYGVSGSPTLILNGATVSEFDFGGRTSDAVKSVVCAGFKTAAGFCSTKLNTAEAATSFSATYASTAAASGNSGATGANCAAAQ